MDDGKVVDDKTKMLNHDPSAASQNISINRDYSKGLVVRFVTDFPSAMAGKVDEAKWRKTILTLNGYYNKAEHITCRTVLETLLSCFSCHLTRFCIDTRYHSYLRKIRQFLVYENINVYVPAGLYIEDPIETGFRVMRIKPVAPGVHPWAIEKDEDSVWF